MQNTGEVSPGGRYDGQPLGSFESTVLSADNPAGVFSKKEVILKKRSIVCL